MRAIALVLFVGALLGAASLSVAQPPGGPGGKEKKGGKGGPGGKAPSVEDMVNRLFAYDTNKDGKLTKDELTDPRLHPLFDRADADKDGAVTKDELTALLTKEAVSLGASGGPGGGFGGPGGGFGPPTPGVVMPPFLQDHVKLTAEQRKELDAIQKDVDARLDKLLTDEQKKALKAMRDRGPGGFPPPPPPQ